MRAVKIIGKAVRVLTVAAVLAVTAPVVSDVNIATAEASTNNAASAKLNAIKAQNGFKPGSCGWTSWTSPYPSGWTNCKAGCWYFVANVANKMFGCYPSGTSGYTLKNPGNFNCVGTVTDSPAANPSSSALQSLMLKAYPGDIIQFKGGPSGWGSYQHTAIVEAVSASGIRIYQHGDSNHVTSTLYNWSSFYNTYLDFDAWTSYTKGIRLYHYKNYSSKYPTSAVTTASAAISISGATYPTTINKGKCFGLKGTITSGSNITSVTGGIYTTSGAAKYSCTIAPKAKSASLNKTYSGKNINNALLFNKLAAGTYVYKVVASNAAGKTVTLINRTFSVVDIAAMTISGATYPSTIAYGKCFGLKGTITSGSNITSVTGGIYTTSGAAKYSCTIAPKAKSASLNKTYSGKNINNALLFNKLPRGTYYYKVVAKNAGGSKTLINRKFVVK